MRDTLPVREQDALARITADALLASWPDVEREADLSQAPRASSGGGKRGPRRGAAAVSADPRDDTVAWGPADIRGGAPSGPLRQGWDRMITCWSSAVHIM
jgi:hypothetical protein